MELSEELLADIAEVFRTVEYGQITFKLSPESKTLDYTIQTTGKLIKEKPQKHLTKNTLSA